AVSENDGLSILEWQGFDSSLQVDFQIHRVTEYRYLINLRRSLSTGNSLHEPVALSTNYAVHPGREGCQATQRTNAAGHLNHRFLHCVIDILVHRALHPRDTTHIPLVISQQCCDCLWVTLLGSNDLL